MYNTEAQVLEIKKAAAEIKEPKGIGAEIGQAMREERRAEREEARKPHHKEQQQHQDTIRAWTAEILADPKAAQKGAEEEFVRQLASSRVARLSPEEALEALLPPIKSIKSNDV